MQCNGNKTESLKFTNVYFAAVWQYCCIRYLLTLHYLQLISGEVFGYSVNCKKQEIFVYMIIYVLYTRELKATFNKKMNSEMFSDCEPKLHMSLCMSFKSCLQKRSISKPTLCLLLENHTEEKRSSFAKASFCLCLYKVGRIYAKLSCSATHTDKDWDIHL